MFALCDEPLLTDSFPLNTPHNVGARLLRHGLAVSAFSSLEKYVTSRFEELFARIGNCPVSYTAFSGDLKRFLTRDAAKGLLNRVSFMEDSLQQSFFEANVVRIAGYLSNPASFTAFGFSPQGSNVSHEDIKKAFAALGLKDAWGKLRSITTGLGSARVSLDDDYRNLAKTRHRSAHDPESNVPSGDLKTHVEIAILIGIAVDVLTSSVADVYVAAQSATDLAARLSTMSPSFRFVDTEPGGTFVERASLTGRAIKRYTTEALAAEAAAARNASQYVIIRSPTTMPVGMW